MKPLLVIGLGNPLMGDDGVGAHVAELLAADPQMAVTADVLSAGTDLLRLMDQIEGRKHVILIDAVESDARPGGVTVMDELPGEERPEYPHSLSAASALELMRRVMPPLARIRFTWVLVHVRRAGAAPGMSPDVAAAAPRVAALVRRIA